MHEIPALGMVTTAFPCKNIGPQASFSLARNPKFPPNVLIAVAVFDGIIALDGTSVTAYIDGEIVMY